MRVIKRVTGIGIAPDVAAGPSLHRLARFDRYEQHGIVVQAQHHVDTVPVGQSERS
jgi:hypothetical protein